MARVFRDARLFVQQWADTQAITVTANGMLKGADQASVFSTLFLDYNSQLRVYNIEAARRHSESGATGRAPIVKPISKDELQHAWIEYVPLMAKKNRQKLINKFTAYKGDNDELLKWLTALTGPNVKEIDLAVMQHFIWQIKRKALGLPVVYHLCPIFFGKQLGGKTTAITKLLSPIKDVMLSYNPDEATDSRVKAGFANNYVCFFDEMANMARVEMEELKKLITADVLTYRPLYSNSFAVTQQNCSFIGGSNKSMTELIYDPTGMRRFYEFICLDKAGFAAVNAVDAMAIFTSIDPKRERGYIEHVLPQLQQHQQQRQSEDEVQHFVKEMQLNEGEPKPILAADLYNQFIIWRAKAGYAAKHAMIITSFGMRLSSLGVKKEVKKIGGVQKTVYSVNAFSPVFSALPGPHSLKGNA